jgi:tRNA A-37 threonylcarbamoyl transferase component Bud32
VTHDPDSVQLTSIGEHYVVDRVIGRGGMATVYLCRDTRDESRVAVKVLRKELGSAIIVERFLREIAFASELDHPRIPKVLSSGVVGDLPYYAMTYVEGESLKQKIEREKQLPLDEAIHIACQVIAPTAYAHSRGIVHRDIKPDNILIAADGVYVLDFGIARAIVESGVDRLTSTGVGVGTPAYMSPEQALGDRNLDARSDIYSLGCVVYEMIAGIPPFVGPTSQAIISRRFAASPPPLSEVRDSVPEEIEDAVQRALARSPADRWPTVGAFGKALEACSTETPTGAVRREKRRRSLRRIAMAATALAIVAAGIVAWTRGHRSSYEKAKDALAAWDLDSAERELRQAASDNPTDASARLWLAQVMMLKGEPASEWRNHAMFARMNGGGLEKADQIRADALIAISADRAPAGCDRFADVLQAESEAVPTAFVGTLALADCLRRDTTVLAGPAPSEFRFRSSYHLADSLYERMLESQSTRPEAYGLIMPRLQVVRAIDKTQYRSGSLSDRRQQTFRSLPLLIADTLAYVPYPISSSGAPWRTRDPEALDDALARNRRRLRPFALRWVSLAPGDPESRSSLARLLEADGELEGTPVSALQELKAARSIAIPGEGPANRYLRQLRLGRDEVRVNLRLGQFDVAGILADSILAWRAPATLSHADQDAAAEVLAALAALRGRGARVVDLKRKFPLDVVLLSTGEVRRLPPALTAERAILDGYSEVGGPGDSILAASERVSELLQAVVSKRDADLMRWGLLSRPLTLGAPAIGPRPVAALGPTSEFFVNALKALSQGNRRLAMSLLDSLSELHSVYAAGEISMDVVYGEAWLRTQLVDTSGATRDLERALRGLPVATIRILRNAELAASLVRAMALRAELAYKAGDRPKAKYWADAVYSLWGRGDFTTRSVLEKVMAYR